MRTAPSLLLACALLCACGIPLRKPTDEESAYGRARIEAAMLAAERARSALELLGILPVYTCGDPRGTWVGDAAGSASAQVGCLTATTEPRGTTADAVVLAFSNGCSARGHVVTGTAAFVFSGGEDRMDLTGDLSALEVDGNPLQTQVGYGVCGDQERYWATSSGAVPSRAGMTYALDVSLRKREGVPIIGDTTLLMDATGTVTGEAGTDHVAITALEYEMGDTFPKTGEIFVQTADGHTVRATFREWLWLLGQAEVQVDGAQPVTIPLF